MESKKNLSFKNQIRSAISVSCALGVVASAHATVISDGDFVDSNWSAQVFTRDNGGTLAAAQNSTWGNPGSSREVIQTVDMGPSLVAGAHIYTASTYTITSGITDLRMSFDFMHSNDAVFYGFIVLQGGNYYIGASSSRAESQWSTYSSGNLLASSFLQLQTSGNLTNTNNPDFSASGSPLQFGIFTANSQSGGGGWYSRTIWLDNFEVEVTEGVPEPATMLAMGMGAAVLLRKRYARK